MKCSSAATNTHYEQKKRNRFQIIQLRIFWICTQTLLGLCASCLSIFPRVLSRSPTSPPGAWLPILQPTPQRAGPRGRWVDTGTDGSGALRAPAQAQDQAIHYAYICAR